MPLTQITADVISTNTISQLISTGFGYINVASLQVQTVNSGASNTFTITTNNTTTLFASNTANAVGFGTSSPQSNSVTIARPIGGGTLALHSVTNPTGDQRLYLIGAGTDADPYKARISFNSDNAWTSTSNTPTYMTFSTTPSGSATVAERIRIDSSGNVGIKITAPTAPLHVNAVPTGYISKFSGTGVSKFYIAAPAADGGIMDLGALNNSEGALTQIRFNGQLNIGSTGNLGLGNATPSSSGAGITFPATQSASSDANTLDDYEEGTWTPTATAITGTITTYTSSGVYTKVGRLVTVQAIVNISNNGTGAAFIRITNLPFAPSSNVFTGSGREVGVSGSQLSANTAGDGTTNLNIFTYAGLYPGGTGASIAVTITYSV